MKNKFLSLLLLCSAAASSFSAFGMGKNPQKSIRISHTLTQAERDLLNREIYNIVCDLSEQHSSLIVYNDGLMPEVEFRQALTKIQEKIKQGGSLNYTVNTVDGKNSSALTVAIATAISLYESAQTLSRPDSAACQLNRPEEYKKRALSFVKFLLEHGAIDEINTIIRNTTHLFKAIKKDADPDLIRLLLKHGAANSIDNKSRPALSLVCDISLDPEYAQQIRNMLFLSGAQPYDDHSREMKAQLEKKLENIKIPIVTDAIRTNIDRHFPPVLAHIIAEYARPTLEDVVDKHQQKAKMKIVKIQARLAALQSNATSTTTQNTASTARNPQDTDDAKHDEHGNVVAPTTSQPSTPMPQAPAFVTRAYANMPQPPQFLLDHYEQQQPDNPAYTTWQQTQLNAAAAQHSSVDDLD